MPRRTSFGLVLAVLFSVYTSAQVALNGVGSTFVHPIFSKWKACTGSNTQTFGSGYLRSKVLLPARVIAPFSTHYDV